MIFECSLFQNIVEDMILYRNASDQEVMSFYKDFADSLSLLDDIVIVDIYPAREKPIPGITSALIYDNLRPGVQKQLCTKDEICDIVRQGGFDVLVTLGAGDIEDYADKITEILRPKA